MFTEHTFDTGEVGLNLAAGPASGPPLLFLHGVTRLWQDFVPLMAALSPRWRVHGLDFRGHGRSQRAPGRYSLADHVRDALALVRSHFREPVAVYGHSLGALCAAAAAATLPGAVRAVILEDPPSAAFLRDLPATMYGTLFPQTRDLARRRLPVPELARALADLVVPRPDGNGTFRLGDVRDATSLRFQARCLTDLDPEVLTPVIDGRWQEGHDLEGTYAGVRCPALLLRGDVAAGGMLGRADAVRVAARMADCTLVELPATGHLIHWQHPETTLRYVTEFLESF
jgi:pimeloyl-ACP methyl ester carboxylesterase